MNGIVERESVEIFHTSMASNAVPRKSIVKGIGLSTAFWSSSPELAKCSQKATTLIAVMFGHPLRLNSVSRVHRLAI
jgi:hypothetical protein